MVAYTLMLSVTSTIAYATIFNVLFDTNRTLSVIIGGVDRHAVLVDRRHVVDHADRHGAVHPQDHRHLLPAAAVHVEPGRRLRRHQGAGRATQPSTSAPSASATIITFFVVYSFGMLIGQDIWQRVFTARSPQVAKWGGTTAAIYCLLYGVAGALIGMAASTFLPDVEAKDDVYAQIAETILPVGISGIVLAAAVAAMMSTASGALIATATVAKTDVKPLLLRMIGRGLRRRRERRARRALRPALRRGARHRRHRDRRPAQRRGGGADGGLRHPGRRTAGRRSSAASCGSARPGRAPCGRWQRAPS